MCLKPICSWFWNRDSFTYSLSKVLMALSVRPSFAMVVTRKVNGNPPCSYNCVYTKFLKPVICIIQSRPIHSSKSWPIDQVNLPKCQNLTNCQNPLLYSAVLCHPDCCDVIKYFLEGFSCKDIPHVCLKIHFCVKFL